MIFAIYWLESAFMSLWISIICKWKVKVLVAQSCPTLCNPMACSPSGPSVHGILQARIPEWVAMTFSRVFPTQGSNRGLLHCRQILYHLRPLGSPDMSKNNQRRLKDWTLILSSKFDLVTFFRYKFIPRPLGFVTLVDGDAFRGPKPLTTRSYILPKVYLGYYLWSHLHGGLRGCRERGTRIEGITV